VYASSPIPQVELFPETDDYASDDHHHIPPVANEALLKDRIMADVVRSLEALDKRMSKNGITLAAAGRAQSEGAYDKTPTAPTGKQARRQISEPVPDSSSRTNSNTSTSNSAPTSSVNLGSAGSASNGALSPRARALHMNVHGSSVDLYVEEPSPLFTRHSDEMRGGKSEAGMHNTIPGRSNQKLQLPTGTGTGSTSDHRRVGSLQTLPASVQAAVQDQARPSSPKRFSKVIL